MHKDESFMEFILDQLSGLGNVNARPMFGGYGLYRDADFFGIIYGGRLYFKTDSSTQPSYQERGMKPFRPNMKQTLKNYYEVPDEIIDESDELLIWALDAIRCCLRVS